MLRFFVYISHLGGVYLGLGNFFSSSLMILKYVISFYNQLQEQICWGFVVQAIFLTNQVACFIYFLHEAIYQ